MANEIQLYASVGFVKDGLARTYPFTANADKADQVYQISVLENIDAAGKNPVLTGVEGFLILTNIGTVPVYVSTHADLSNEFLKLLATEFSLLRIPASTTFYVFTTGDDIGTLEVTEIPSANVNP